MDFAVGDGQYDGHGVGTHRVGAPTRAELGVTMASDVIVFARAFNTAPDVMPGLRDPTVPRMQTSFRACAGRTPLPHISEITSLDMCAVYYLIGLFRHFQFPQSE